MQQNQRVFRHFARGGEKCGLGVAKGEERAEPILNIGERAPQTIAAHGAVSAAQGDTV